MKCARVLASCISGSYWVEDSILADDAGLLGEVIFFGEARWRPRQSAQPTRDDDKKSVQLRARSIKEAPGGGQEAPGGQAYTLQTAPPACSTKILCSSGAYIS